MAETYYQKLANRISVEAWMLTGEDEYEFVPEFAARILEEELSGIVIAAQEYVHHRDNFDIAKPVFDQIGKSGELLDKLRSALLEKGLR